MDQWTGASTKILFIPPYKQLPLGLAGYISALRKKDPGKNPMQF